MDNPRNILRRIKWRSVSLAIVLLLVVFFIIIGFNPFGLDYKGEGDIKIKSWLEPAKIGLRDSSKVWVEVMNTGKESEDVEIFLETYDPDVKFLGETQKENATVSLGPGESRKLNFKINVRATYGGNYGISIKVKYGREFIKDEVYITVLPS